MTRNARTKQFRKGIQEEYFNNLIEGYKKKIFYDNFEHIYDNKVIVEKAIELGIIVWSFDWWKKEDSISNHPNLSLDWIEKFPYKNWHCENISKHPNLQLEWIERIEKSKISYQSQSGNIPMGWILIKIPSRYWDWYEISRNPNLELTWIEKYPDKDWDWSEISRNPNLELTWIERFPNNPWYFFMCNSKFKILKANLISKKYENIILYSNYIPRFQNPETEIILKKKRHSWKNILKLYNIKLSKQLKISKMKAKRY